MSEAGDESREGLAGSWTQAMERMYFLRCVIDAQTGEYTLLAGSEPDLMPETGLFREAIGAYAANRVEAEDRLEFSVKCQPEYMLSQLRSGVNDYSFEYRQLGAAGQVRWVHGAVIRAEDSADGTPRRFVFAARYIDADKRERALLAASFRMMKDTYYRIGCIDLETNTMETVVIAEGEAQDREGYGRDYRAAITKTALDYVLPAYRDSFLGLLLPENIRAALADGQEYASVTYQRFEGRQVVWVRSEIIPMSGYGETNHRVMWYVKNVAEQKALEEQMSRRLVQVNADLNRRIDTILDGIAGGFKISSLEGEKKCLYASESFLRFLGFNQEELGAFGRFGLADLLHPEDHDACQKSLWEQLARGDAYRLRYRVRRKDGSYRWVLDTGKRIRDAQRGELMYSLFQDVTELESLTARYAKERRLYRDALTASCVFFFTVDVTEGLLRTDGQAALDFTQWLGLTTPARHDEVLDAWLAREQPRLRKGDDWAVLRRESLLQCFARGETTVEVEYMTERSDTIIRLTALLSQNANDGHVMAVLLATDVTQVRREEERRQQALEASVEAAERANRIKADFLSRMSHDICTPMNAIIGMASIAGAHLDDQERVRDCLTKIATSSRYLMGFINDILDMSRIESGRMSLREDEISLPELLSAVTAIMQSEVERKGHSVRVDLARVRHETVWGDSQRIQQVLINILSNAIIYTPEGGSISITVTEKPAEQQRVGCYEFAIADNGIGMTQEFMKRLYMPFERAEDLRVSKTQGTGLGMTISRNLVQLMGGTIRVESEVGRGTCCTVSLNLRQVEEEPSNPEGLRGKHVLVADGDEAAGACVCQMLRELGMAGEHVRDGQEAVDRAWQRYERQEGYFAVILDERLPGLGGLEAVRRIRRLMVQDAPPIILSAQDWRAIEPEARQAGVDAFFSKPAVKADLLRLLHAFMTEEQETPETDGMSVLSQQNFAGRRVLLVEDNELNREIAMELLSTTGVTIDTAENGREAVEKTRESAVGFYDMILMDIQMPVMTGYDACRAIRALNRPDAASLPIVAMTANTFTEDVQEAQSAGMNGYIAKPVDLTVLSNTLKRWLTPENS